MAERLVLHAPMFGKGDIRLYLPDTPFTHRELDWVLRGVNMVLEILREEPDWSLFGLPMEGTENLYKVTP